jgi:hypothetical protein
MKAAPSYIDQAQTEKKAQFFCCSFIVAERTAQKTALPFSILWVSGYH